MRPAALITACLLVSCIGFKPFGLRKVEFRTSKAYYMKGSPKEIVHTRRIFIKDCPGCPERIKSRKKEYAPGGRLIYMEKVKRRMYKAKLVKLNSTSYYENGTLKEKRKLVRGSGYIRQYDAGGKRVLECKFKNGKILDGDSTSVKDMSPAEQ